jgi:hypothetical protein
MLSEGIIPTNFGYKVDVHTLLLGYWRGSSLRREAVTAIAVITSALFEIQ